MQIPPKHRLPKFAIAAAVGLFVSSCSARAATESAKLLEHQRVGEVLCRTNNTEARQLGLVTLKHYDKDNAPLQSVTFKVLSPDKSGSVHYAAIRESFSSAHSSKKCRVGWRLGSTRKYPCWGIIA